VIAELGSFALVLALCLSLTQLGLSFAGRFRGSAALRGAGEGAAAGAFLAMLVAFGSLVYAFVTSDFSVSNVAMNSHTEKPLLYKIAGSWGSHEGSMILWCMVLCGFGSAVALTGRDLPAGLRASAIGVQGGLGAMFIAFTLFTSNPFTRLAEVPIEGRSLNPVLQDPAFAFHPPLLYCGYVGLSLVFSFAVAALIEGRADAAWARWVRPWTLAAWSFLTVGITLGAFWAYYELGWGGWWAWDPVENASFMPWLMATALLHSAIVTEKRGALAGWTLFLAIAAFTFAMLGAFLVRSGVLMSVHAFAVDPQRGLILLTILGLAAGGAFALYAWRIPKLAPGGVFAPVSRETTLVLNNIFLSAATATVLLGTLYPLIVEAIVGRPISVGTPYFNLTFAPLMAIALIILPAGPLLAWKRGDLKGVGQRLAVAAGLGLLAAAASLMFLAPKQVLAAFGAGVGVWVMAGTLTEVVERIRLGRVPFSEALRRVRSMPRGSWGTTLAHFGMGLFIFGACFELAAKVESAKVITVGESVQVGAYELRLDAVNTIDGPNYLAERASFTAIRNGQVACKPQPERRMFYAGNQTTSEVALCLEGPSDLYVTMGETRTTPAGQPGWLVTGYFNPWVRLIFLGPFMMALGGVISLTDRRLRLGVARKTAKAKASGAVGATA